MSMLRLWLIMACLLLALPALCDTGTYTILDYQVSLTPHADGKVRIDYYQKWEVTGGVIPWITIGTPNANFTIADSGGAVTAASPANQGDWSGVRLDLERDYRPGETFEARVSIDQDKLFYADETDYHLDFTPGWYDRAAINAMQIRVRSFVPVDSITADPSPSTTTEEELVWTRSGLSPGERFSISISFPKSTAPQAIPEENLRDAGGIGASDAAIGWIVIIGIIVLVIIIIAASRSSHPRGRGRGYSGGSIFYGGGVGHGDGDDSPRPRTGGGGGFGGGGFSCACACVSCACACACAGGGGAGCSRKQRHACPACRGERNPNIENNTGSYR